MKALSHEREGQIVPQLENQQQVNGLLRTFVALRHRNFRLFWFGQLISLIGTWMQTVGQAWLVLQLTHSAWLLGVVGALQFLPVMLLSLFGGVLADRLPKRRVLLFTQSFAMLQAVVLWILVASGHIQVWEVLVLASLLGLTNSFDMPTRQAFVVEMVGREDLPNAIALNSSVFNMARVVGPGLGGLIIAFLGIAPLFLLNTISFVPVIVGLALIRMNELHALAKRTTTSGVTSKQCTLQSLREGLSYVIHTPSILLIIAVIGVISLFGINFNVILPLFATEVLHSGAMGFGLLSAAFGLGSLCSALWLAWGNRKPSVQYLLIAALAFSANSNTALQTVTPDHLRGRVLSVYMVVFAGSVPLGNLFTGGLAHLYGAPISLIVGACLSLVAAIVGWILRSPAEKSLAEASLIRS